MAKKKLLIGLSVLVVLLAIAVVVLAVTYRGYVGESFVSDGENWSAEVNGGEMTLDLPSNPSTGFSWVGAVCTAPAGILKPRMAPLAEVSVTSPPIIWFLYTSNVA